jgi:hypothetical protein
MTPDLGFVLGLAAASAVLARTAAAKRNRHVALWGVICFCCPIALLVIWSLDRLPPRLERPATVPATAGQTSASK